MLLIPLQPTDAKILSVVEAWVDVLANGQFESALAIVEHNPVRTASELKELIEGYGRMPPHGHVSTRITPPRAAIVADISPSHHVTWFGPHPDRAVELEAFVTYDLPVNGVWSDLTALFWLKRISHGYVLQLEDIHVL